MAVLAVVAVGALVATHILQQKLDVAKSQIDAVHAKVVAAQNEKHAIRTVDADNGTCGYVHVWITRERFHPNPFAVAARQSAA